MALVKAWLVPGTPRLGLWCPQCLTSGASETSLYCLSAKGVCLWRVVRQCTSCDRPGR